MQMPESDRMVQQIHRIHVHLSRVHCRLRFPLSLTFNTCRYGYRGIDARRNLWVLPSGELLYYVAAVAVLLDREEESQRHYTGHTEDIMWYVLLSYASC